MRARALRGLHFKFEGEWEAALAEFDRVLALAPPERLRHDVLTSRACIQLSRGRVDKALSILEGVAGETRDWDQIKFVNSWIAEVRRRRSRQFGAADSCGSKALAFLLRSQGREVTSEQLAAAIPVSGDSTLVSLASLQRGAAQLGLAFTGVKVSLEQLDGLPLPAIALLKPGHYAVITAVRDGRVTIFDPDRGVASYTPAVLARKWTGFVLLMGMDTPRPGLALAGPEEMQRLEGGVCPCCPQGNTGDSRNPSVKRGTIPFVVSLSNHERNSVLSTSTLRLAQGERY